MRNKLHNGRTLFFISTYIDMKKQLVEHLFHQSGTNIAQISWKTYAQSASYYALLVISRPFSVPDLDHTDYIGISLFFR